MKIDEKVNKENKNELEREGKLIATNYLNTNYLDHEEICALISYAQKLVGRLSSQHDLTFEEIMFLDSAYDDLGRAFASHFRKVAKKVFKEE